MIKVENLTKKFDIKNKGKKDVKVALNEITFEIQKGSVVGLIGANGSGKSTLLKVISSLYQPSNGIVHVDGLDVTKHQDETKKKIGILFGGEAGLYGRLTAFENIKYFGELNGLELDEINQAIEEYETFFNMKDYMHRRVENFSRGMKQKVLFLRSVIHNPEIIILDEPSTGLDVAGINEVAEFIRFNKRNHKTIIISSHNMNEIASLCEDLIILRDGNLAYFGPISNLVTKQGNYDQLYELMGVKYERV
ncbi:MAG: ABC transporter ATP-binding protein [Acholeplasmataceae bacterium]|jgi:sodium transport system ATP-binding protein